MNKPIAVTVCWLLGLGAGARGAASETATRGLPAVDLREGEIVIPTYPWGPDNPNPSFSRIDGRGIYPYPMQDNLSRDRVERRYATVEIENEFLHVTLIPELGGHVHSVLDKSTGTQVFYVNQVVKPGLIGLRGAWISGGIEFNTGPQGHTVSAVSPLRWAAGRRPDGSAWIAVGDRERIHETQWVVEAILRPGRSFLEERIRIANPTLLPRSYYYWNCTAVPNTPGMQFVYPMTLGTDHAGTRFYRWPIDNGVDLSLSRNYRQPSSIFAYECDQDFFGSYDHDADRGVVAYANRHLVPGKKAWTWGLADDGIVAQSTLTDDGSLYNEVQTGPLRTQADYGLIAPRQTIEWREWWYPVHGLGGFDFANRDVAAKVERPGQGAIEVRLLGTGRWPQASVELRRDGGLLGRQAAALDPARPVRVRFAVDDPLPPIEVSVLAGRRILARFTHPLPLPEREPPAEAEAPPDSSAYARLQQGSVAERSGNLAGAREHYAAALERDPQLAPALIGTGVIDLKEQRWNDAEASLRRALAVDPELGLGAAYLGLALLRQGRAAEAADWAWRAARRSGAATPGSWLVGALAMGDPGLGPAAAAAAFLQAVGHDPRDIPSRLGVAVAQHRLGRERTAREQLRQALRHDPLDATAQALARLWGQEELLPERGASIAGRAQPLLDAAATCLDLGARELARAILEREWRDCLATERESHPLPWYFLAYLAGGDLDAAAAARAEAGRAQLDHVFPHRDWEAEVLRWSCAVDPGDWRAPYLLGTQLYARDQVAQALELWQEAERRGARSSVLSRNLAVHHWKIERDLEQAAARFAEALDLRPDDPTLYRDLAAVEGERDRWEVALGLLERGAALPIQRSDVLEALGRAYHRLGRDIEAAALLDRSRFSAWEGQQSMHDLFVDVHLSLGEKALTEAGDATAAEREFRRALEYPRNLSVGKPDNADQSRLWRALARALAAQGRDEEAAEARQRASGGEVRD